MAPPGIAWRQRPHLFRQAGIAFRAALIALMPLMSSAAGAADARAADARTQEQPILTILFSTQDPMLGWDAAAARPTGSLYDFTQKLAHEAGVVLRWEPPRTRRRVLADLEERADAACTVAIARTAERAARFKFTAPMTAAPDWVILTRADDKRIGSPASLMALRDRPDLTLGIPDGSFMESLIDGQPGTAAEQAVTPPAPNAAGNRQRITGTSTTLLAMLAKGRVDYIPFDLNTLAAQAGLLGMPANAFRALRLPELAFVGQGYMACGSATPDAVIDRLNRAVVRTGLYSFE